MKKINKQKILIVGGTGFIGYHLTLAVLKKNWDVTSLSLNKPKKCRYVEGAKYLIADISNIKKLKKKLKNRYTYVVNLAGYVEHTFIKRKKNNFPRTHLLGLINLVKIFSKKKLKNLFKLVVVLNMVKLNHHKQKIIFAFQIHHMV